MLTTLTFTSLSKFALSNNEGKESKDLPISMTEQASCTALIARRPSGYVLHEGVNIAYYVQGKGRPIIITPVAWGLAGAFLLDLMPIFGRWGQVVTFDPPGTGSSSDAVSELQLGIEGVTSALYAVVTHLKLSPICLVGHSNGGQCALKYAVDNWRNISGLILISTSGRDHLRAGEEPWPEPLRKAWRRAATIPTRRNFANVVRHILSELRGRRNAELRSLFLGRVNPARLKVTTEELRRFDLLREVRMIEVPTLLIAGEDDHIIPVRLVKELSRHIPRSKLRIMLGTGHFPFYTKPREFARLVGKFLRYDMKERRVE